MKLIFSLTILFLLAGCKSKKAVPITPSPTPSDNYEITLSFDRNNDPGLDSFDVTARLTKNGSALSGQTFSLNVPKGSVSSIVDQGSGMYSFTVTPSTTGVYPVTVTYQTASASREALVFSTIHSDLGQPLSVPGDVNSEGYEDGITITPNGEYLFVQYGPLYFSGLLYYKAICPPDASYSLYNLMGCSGNQDASWVFNTVGPYNNSLRPNFPVGSITNNTLQHLNIEIPGVVNKIALFPTVFYGFKRQSDGSFKNPFKLAFNDVKGANGPFGLSFHMTSSTSAEFAVAWNNYFNDLGDDKPDVYAGAITFGQDNNLGDVTYSGELFQSISPNIEPVSFSSHTGVQGNPHLYYDQSEVIQSIWTDDEQTTHDLTVYKISSGTFPDGTWSAITLPSVINTASEESQPFFTGSKLYLRRGDKIVSHAYVGSGHNDYHLNSSWGAEVTLLSASSLNSNEMITVGEPTLASYNGKTYLYFAYGFVRSISASGRRDINLNAGFVELP